VGRLGFSVLGRELKEGEAEAVFFWNNGIEFIAISISEYLSIYIFKQIEI
jgi:hypothetical protein